MAQFLNVGQRMRDRLRQSSDLADLRVDPELELVQKVAQSIAKMRVGNSSQPLVWIEMDIL